MSQPEPRCPPRCPNPGERFPPPAPPHRNRPHPRSTSKPPLGSRQWRTDRDTGTAAKGWGQQPRGWLIVGCGTADASPWDGDVVTALEWGSAGRACWCQGSPPAPSADRTQSHGQVGAQGAPSCLLGKRQTMAVTPEMVTPEMVMLGWAWPPPPGQGPLAWPCTQQGGASGPGHRAETGLLCPWSGQLENQDICAKGPATAAAPQVGNASQDLRMLC